MSRLSAWPGALGAAAALVLSPALSQRAHAFGGVWSSQTGPLQQSAAQVIFVDNPGPTVTAIIRIEYAGPAQQFAWLIPVPGEPTVGVSSNAVFERLDAATAPEYWIEVAVDGMCLDQEGVDPGMQAGADPGAAPVLVGDRGTAGALDYVTLVTDPSLGDPAEAATAWLTTNGYDLSGIDAEVLASYLDDGLNLLAFKLASESDPGAIRPVVLTYESELPVIPILPAAVAAQQDMPLQVWVVGPSRAVPDNYASLELNDARIDWLTGTTFVANTLPAGGAGPFGEMVRAPGNYDAVVTAAADEAGGHGFVTELAAPASQFRDKVWSALDDETFATLSSQTYDDGVDAILAAHEYYGRWDGWNEAVAGAITLPDGVTIDDFGRSPDAYRGAVEVDVAELFQRLADDVITPVADAGALLFAAPYLTRLYTTLSADEMTVDPVFTYNFDLAQVGNVHIAQQWIDCSPTLRQGDAPWRIELPLGGVIAGEGSAWPVDEESTPANLKIVMLSDSGAGTVLEDNSALIGGGEPTTPGGEPEVDAGQGERDAGRGERDAGPDRAEPSRGGECAVSVPGAGAGFGAGKDSTPLALCWPLAGAILALRRRRRQSWAHARGYARFMLFMPFMLALLLAGCDGSDNEPAAAGDDAGAAGALGAFSREQLRDPETCKGCHPIHYRQWSSSMHAYSARDPVFLAMNRRGQRETRGELGDFCVRCHAPMAVVDGLTEDGLDLEQLPDLDRGVSCYFCHNVVDVEGDHNAMLRLAGDSTMRGPIRDPVDSGVHRAAYSDMFEDTSPKSTALCGGCHDIVTPSGVHLERTFQEYRDGIFAKSATGEPPAFDSCVGCHMPPQNGLAATAPAGVGERTVHEHLWPGVDVALEDFPHREAMRSAVEDCQLSVSVSFFTLEVTPPDLFSFQMETGAGHNQPSGSAQDRRMWLEFMAYDDSGRLLEDVSSGDIADGEVEEKPEGDPEHDPHLLLFRDRIFGARGEPVHMFWEAKKSAAHPDGYESNVLPVATTTYIEGKHAVIKQYRAHDADGQLPARVTARLRMRPIGADVLQDLVESGDLDPAIAAQMPTFTFGAQIEWTPEDGTMKTIPAEPRSDCSTYRCLLDRSSPECR